MFEMEGSLFIMGGVCNVCDSLGIVIVADVSNQRIDLRAPWRGVHTRVLVVFRITAVSSATFIFIVTIYIPFRTRWKQNNVKKMQFTS